MTVFRMNISAQKERNNVTKKSNLIQFCSKESAPNFAICSRDNIVHNHHMVRDDYVQ
jgi:hypothetical protein